MPSLSGDRPVPGPAPPRPRPPLRGSSSAETKHLLIYSPPTATQHQQLTTTYPIMSSHKATLYHFRGSCWAAVPHLTALEKGFTTEQLELKEVNL